MQGQIMQCSRNTKVHVTQLRMLKAVQSVQIKGSSQLRLTAGVLGYALYVLLPSAPATIPFRTEEWRLRWNTDYLQYSSGLRRRENLTRYKVRKRPTQGSSKRQLSRIIGKPFYCVGQAQQGQSKVVISLYLVPCYSELTRSSLVASLWQKQFLHGQINPNTPSILFLIDKH